MEDQVEDEKKRKRLEIQKRYRQKNREKLNEKNKQYRLENKEKVEESRKRWKEANPEKEALHQQNRWKRYKEKNAEKVKLSQKLWYEANKERYRENKLKRNYNITLDDYDKMLQEQNGCCAICFVKAEDERNKILVVDHNHLTGEVRSLLCNGCNTAIGLLKENQEVILRAADYLKKFSATLTDEQVAAK
jgi:single-stranded DNA-specific DHH superfamily exonuclease